MTIDKLKWLEGQWEGIQDNGIYHEEWETDSDGMMNGRAYLIKKGEISNPEKLKLHADENGIYYTAEVSHNPGPVTFRLTYSDENKFVFENPQHDFPKMITYERKDANNLVATIEEGKKKFEFKLMKF